MLKTPQFWFERSSFLSNLLIPLSCTYASGCAIKNLLTSTQRLSKPVICIGNITLGGAGKTPTVIALTEILKKMGHTPHILSRGYGRKSTSFSKVSVNDDAEIVGDEPLLLARHAPTWVSSDRYQSGKKAVQDGATVLLMDDGLQNSGLHKTLSFLVIDGAQGLGNGRIFPAGPLRMSLQQTMQHVSAVILIHPTEELCRIFAPYFKPILKAFFTPKNLPIPPQPVIAFTGLGYPQKFKLYLETLGFDIKEFFAFPDHYYYLEKDYEQLNACAHKHGLPLITTEKDFVKIKQGSLVNLQILGIRLMFDDKNEVKNLFASSISS